MNNSTNTEKTKILQSDSVLHLQSDINYHLKEGWKIFSFQSHLAQELVKTNKVPDSMIHTVVLIKTATTQ